MKDDIDRRFSVPASLRTVVSRTVNKAFLTCHVVQFIRDYLTSGDGIDLAKTAHLPATKKPGQTTGPKGVTDIVTSLHRFQTCNVDLLDTLDRFGRSGGLGGGVGVVDDAGQEDGSINGID